MTAVAAPERPTQQPAAGDSGRPPLKVIIAGGGIGGLVLAVGLLKRGFDVTVLERDMTAIRGEGKYRGPIQVRRQGLPAALRRGAAGCGGCCRPLLTWLLCGLGSCDQTMTLEMAAAAGAHCPAAIAAAAAWIHGAAAMGLWCQAAVLGSCWAHPAPLPQPLGWRRRHGMQIQSNALAALEALDTHVAQRVYEEGCITGDRINGLCDGVTGDWCAGEGGRGRGCCRRVRAGVLRAVLRAVLRVVVGVCLQVMA